MGIVVERTTPKVDSSSNVAVLVFTGTPTVGNDIIAVSNGYDPGATAAPGSCADDATSGSNTYSSVIYAEESGGTAWLEIFRADVVRTKSNLNVTVTAVTGVGNVTCAAAMEVSGLADSPVDKTGSNVADITSTWSQATGVLAQADELIVGVFCYNASGPSTFNLAPAGAWVGATQLYINDGPSITAEYGIANYRIVSATASVLVEYSSNTGSSAGSPIAIATFKALPGPPTYNVARPPGVLLNEPGIPNTALRDVRAWF